MDITIIILNYNTTHLVRRALESLQKFHLSTKIKTQVIVVDNGSSDRSLSTLQKEFPFIEVIELEKNLGFAGGNNVALRQVKTEYVLLLNSDTEFTEKTQLPKMLGYMEKNPQVAVMTPRLELANGKIDWASHRGEPTPWAALTYFSGLEKMFPSMRLFGQYHQTYKKLNTIHLIDACSGAAMIIRSTAMKKVGLLDEQFFMYAEDLDWCKRFREAGYSIVYFPESVIIHHKYQSGVKHSDQKIASKTTQYFYETMLQYYDKHYHRHYPGFVRFIIKKVIDVKKEKV